jgi:hypothetical protein
MGFMDRMKALGQKITGQEPGKIAQQKAAVAAVLQPALTP